MPADFPALSIPRTTVGGGAKVDPFALEALRQRNRLQALYERARVDPRGGSGRTPSLRDLSAREEADIAREHGPGAMRGERSAIEQLGAADPGKAVTFEKQQLENVLERSRQMARLGRGLLDAPEQARPELYRQARAWAAFNNMDTSKWPTEYPGDDRIKLYVNMATTLEQRLALKLKDPAEIESRAEAEARGKAKGEAAVPGAAGGGRMLDRQVIKKLAEEGGLSPQRAAALAAGSGPRARDVATVYGKLVDDQLDDVEIMGRMARIFGHDWQDVMRGGTPIRDPTISPRPPRPKPAERLPGGGAAVPLRPTSGLGQGPSASAVPQMSPMTGRGRAPPPDLAAENRGSGTRDSPFQLSPHGPDADAEFETIRPGEFFINPVDGAIVEKL